MKSHLTLKDPSGPPTPARQARPLASRPPTPAAPTVTAVGVAEGSAAAMSRWQLEPLARQGERLSLGTLRATWTKIRGADPLTPVSALDRPAIFTALFGEGCVKGDQDLGTLFILRGGQLVRTVTAGPLPSAELAPALMRAAGAFEAGQSVIVLRMHFCVGLCASTAPAYLRGALIQ